MEKYDFIKLMLKSRNLSVNDKKRLVLLATQEIEKKEEITERGTESPDGDKSIIKERPHAPKDTAAFLSLFNLEDGFKFLTHDFGPNQEMEYSQLLERARNTFRSAKDRYNIPKSLYALMFTMLYGRKDETWMDSYGKRQTETFACNKWIQWAKDNAKIHILSNESIKRIVYSFRSTIRLVLSEDSDSQLKTIIKRQEKKHANLSIISENFNNADEFYTYVNYLEKGVKLILDDMSKRFKESPKVKISYESSLNDDYRLCVIKITQYGSFSPKSLEDVQSKFRGGGGDFYSIRNTLYGYSNWSVESKWEDKALRWNILDDTGKEEIEELYFTDIPGFTHIITYYYKVK